MTGRNGGVHEETKEKGDEERKRRTEERRNEETREGETNNTCAAMRNHCRRTAQSRAEHTAQQATHLGHTQREDAVQVSTGDREPARDGTGRHESLVERDGFAVGKCHRLGARTHRHNASVRHHLRAATTAPTQ
jgi:hypothetical protein